MTAELAVWNEFGPFLSFILMKFSQSQMSRLKCWDKTFEIILKIKVIYEIYGSNIFYFLSTEEWPTGYETVQSGAINKCRLYVWNLKVLLRGTKWYKLYIRIELRIERERPEYKFKRKNWGVEYKFKRRNWGAEYELKRRYWGAE